MRGTNVLALIIASLTFFVSCAPNNASSPTTSGVPPLGGNPTSVPAQGTADSGGGNTFLGKPLESYKVKIRDLEAFKKVVAPIVESKNIKGTRIGNAMATIIDKKVWYVIPAELKQLSAEKIGAAVGGEQAALQDFHQVWMSSLVTDGMKVDEYGVLLLHEIFMGLKLLKFDSAQAHCLAYQADTSLNDVQSCYSPGYEIVRGKPSDLTELDYAQIRNATSLILEAGPGNSYSGWETTLGSQGFIDIPVTKSISLTVLGQMIEASKLMKTWPTYGFNLTKLFIENSANLDRLKGATLQSELRCDFDVKIEGDVFTVLLRENGKETAFSSKWTSMFDLRLLKDDPTGFHLYTADSPTLKVGDSSTKGSDVLYFRLQFLGDLLTVAYIDKLVCLNDDCSKSGQGLNPESVSCYLKPSIRLSNDRH